MPRGTRKSDAVKLVASDPISYDFFLVFRSQLWDIMNKNLIEFKREIWNPKMKNSSP